MSGSLVLALLPALGRVRRSPALAAGLGPGVLGGYTTLSAYSEETRALLADDRVATGAAYVARDAHRLPGGRRRVVSRFTTPAEQAEFAAEGGDE